jgi:hsdS
MKKIANQAVVQIINKSQFSQIQIPLPPLEEQKKIVAYLDELNATISKLKSEYQSQLAMLDEMRNSSIDLAF